MATATKPATQPSMGWQNFMYKLNTEWHERALQVFLLIVIAHWMEHIVQAVQVFILLWPRPQAGGVLGLFFPWLVKSEWLHYGYAIVMLVGLVLLRPGFTGRARVWWDISLGIQFWHHIEHLLLLSQALAHYTLFGKPVPTSIVQLIIPRVELHIFYNALVFVPMVVAMFYHMYPPASERGKIACTCVRHYVEPPKQQAEASA